MLIQLLKQRKKSTQKDTSQTSKKSAQKDQPTLIAENTTFTLTLSAEEIAKTKQQVLQKAQKQAKFEGFRQGKAPLAMVEERLGANRVRDMVLEELLSDAYVTYIREHKLMPLTDPAVSAESVEEGKDWTFKVEIAETPEVELGDYQKIVQETKKSHELWKDSKKKDDKKEETPEEMKRQQQISALLEGILEKVTIKIPELLVRKETERALHEFGHQLEHMNVSLDDYLEKVGKSIQDIHQEYAARALMNLQVEFLLGAIVRAEKIELPEKEVTEILSQVENPSEDQRQYVIASLLKQKAVDHLLTV
ncbi:trigger factor family protein [Candidatus Woesebacteria bacterium]|nr:trigger factor family protein [Candidatus Woesebacteria bacterium]